MKTPAQKLYEYWAQEADAGVIMPVWEQLLSYEQQAWRKLWEKVPEILGAPDLEQMDRDLVAAWEKGRDFQRRHPNMTELVVRQTPFPLGDAFANSAFLKSLMSTAPEPMVVPPGSILARRDPLPSPARVSEDAPEISGAQHHRNCPSRTGRGDQCRC